jgi:hypothetical protein
MNELLRYERIEEICDLFVLPYVNMQYSLRFGMYGNVVYECSNVGFDKQIKLKKEHIAKIDHMIDHLRRTSMNKTLILGTSVFSSTYNEYIISCLSDRFRFVIVCIHNDFPLECHRLKPFEKYIDGIFSTMLLDSQALMTRGVRLLPIGLLQRRPNWCLDKRMSTSTDHLLYVNFTINCGMTNLRYIIERWSTERALESNGFVIRSTESHESMLQSMSRSKFCAAPHGAGIDTHRFWEAMSVGCALVSTDWFMLRSLFRGRLPVVWIKQFAPNADICETADPPRIEVMPGIYADCFGDVYVDKWADVTRDRLRVAHRFVGWRRSSELCRNIVSANYWIAQILRCVRH